MPNILEYKCLVTKLRESGIGAAFVIASAVVAAVWLLTNHIAPQWDMHYYLDMATHGLLGNRDLAAPFAYRPGAPLLVGAISHVFGFSPGRTFRVCDAAMCVVFILSCFYFARWLGASFFAAIFAGTILALNFNVVKWTLFSGTMVDIYAYPFLLAAFAALLRKRFYLCLGICAIGLFFKEFLLVPIAVQTVLLMLNHRLKGWTESWKPLLLTGLVLLVCFVLPRLTIHVARTFQDIDPINDSSTIRRLLTYPLSRRHDFNILFAYLAGWLPVLLLLSPSRVQLLWRRLYPYLPVLALFMAFHFVLVMYGGTNINIYITYCVPLQVMALIILLDEGNVRKWEVGLVLIAVIAFNRIWMTIPLPENGLDAYLDFYGGYYMRVTRSSFFRMGEVFAYLLVFAALRFLSKYTGGSQADRRSASQIPSEVMQ
ncbi:MAG: hypothetical protein JO182_25130 [Acidobacteriaceae bacterium]|nr:hypothetical protein [Acidobacteriaceae bacterium]